LPLSDKKDKCLSEFNLHLTLIFKLSVFIYTADHERIYDLGWNLTTLTVEQGRLNQFGCKRADNALLFNKPISDYNSVGFINDPN